MDPVSLSHWSAQTTGLTIKRLGSLGSHVAHATGSRTLLSKVAAFDRCVMTTVPPAKFSGESRARGSFYTQRASERARERERRSQTSIEERVA